MPDWPLLEVVIRVRGTAKHVSLADFTSAFKVTAGASIVAFPYTSFQSLYERLLLAELYMRQRITFIHEPQDAIDPKSFQISDGKLGPSLTLYRLKAAREDRITFSYDELPEEVRQIFERTSEVHIKYVQSGPNMTLAPFNARVASGLHVWFEDHQGAGMYVDQYNIRVEALAKRMSASCQNG